MYCFKIPGHILIDDYTYCDIPEWITAMFHWLSWKNCVVLSLFMSSLHWTMKAGVTCNWQVGQHFDQEIDNTRPILMSNGTN